MLVEKGLGEVLGGLQGWCENNVDLKFGLSLLALSIIPFTRETSLTFWGQIHFSSVSQCGPGVADKSSWTGR